MSIPAIRLQSKFETLSFVVVNEYLSEFFRYNLRQSDRGKIICHVTCLSIVRVYNSITNMKKPHTRK